MTSYVFIINSLTASVSETCLLHKSGVSSTVLLLIVHVCGSLLKLAVLTTSLSNELNSLPVIFGVGSSLS